ncbi:hypothetical protein X797_004979 [Metarhizium robertsii]|uniref:Uncharacterized protein n=1 Tax=Metarhizium robertsii TaxID=568076 RepID=A0A0A1UW47_9HYPO|nr:hypothetical protein X797_004979 [Metarhizium robertsii]
MCAAPLPLAIEQSRNVAATGGLEAFSHEFTHQADIETDNTEYLMMKAVDSDRYSPRLRHLSLQRATTSVEPGHFLQRAETLLEEGIRCLLSLGRRERKRTLWVGLAADSYSALEMQGQPGLKIIAFAVTAATAIHSWQGYDSSPVPSTFVLVQRFLCVLQQDGTMIPAIVLTAIAMISAGNKSPTSSVDQGEARVFFSNETLRSSTSMGKTFKN